jgi:hypothetical protein
MDKEKILLLFILIHEALDPTFGVQELRFAGVEGMTVRANLYFDVLARRASFNHVSAGTANSRFTILGMNCVFHKAPIGNKSVS